MGVRRLGSCALLLASTAVLAGCATLLLPPRPAAPTTVESPASAAPAPLPSAPAAAPPAAPAPAPEPVEPPAPAAAPSSFPSPLPPCADLWSPETTAWIVDFGFTLRETTAREFDPGAEPEEILADRGDDRICLWESSSIHYGIVTRFTRLDPAEAETVRGMLGSSGVDTEELLGGTRYFQTTVTPAADSVDGVDTESGRSDYLRGELWISTRWIGGAPSGYTRDILEHLD